MLNNQKKLLPAMGVLHGVIVRDLRSLSLISYKQHQDSPTASTRSIVDLKGNPDKSVVSNNTVSATRTMGSVNAEDVHHLPKNALHQYRQAGNHRLVFAQEKRFELTSVVKIAEQRNVGDLIDTRQRRYNSKTLLIERVLTIGAPLAEAWLRPQIGWVLRRAV